MTANPSPNPSNYRHAKCDKALMAGKLSEACNNCQPAVRGQRLVITPTPNPNDSADELPLGATSQIKMVCWPIGDADGPLADKLTDIQLEHVVKAQGRNLGEYRTEYDCGCGQKVYVDHNSEDRPNLPVAQSLHITSVLLAAFTAELRAVMPEKVQLARGYRQNKNPNDHYHYKRGFNNAIDAMERKAGERGLL